MSDFPEIGPDSFFYTEEDFNYWVSLLRNNLQSFFVVDEIRKTIADNRFRYFYMKNNGISAMSDYDGDAVASLTIEHNINGIVDTGAPRSHFLLRPLMSINEVLNSCYGGGQFLSIGPRSEGEIINMMGYGIPKHQIHALDLISYSPWVDKGDMHDMSYEDDRFSVIILGFVPGYSKKPEKLASELKRIAKKDCIIAIGNEYNPKSNEELRLESGYDVWEVLRYNSVDDIIKIFEPFIDKILFQTEPSKADRGSTGNLGLIFRVKK